MKSQKKQTMFAKKKKHFENKPDNIVKTISTAGGIKKEY
jgi:hypothetical protein